MNKLIVLACLLALTYGAAVPRMGPNKRLFPIFPNGRIVGGSNTDISKVPYQVAFETTGGFQFCGGSIISSTWILTAGHCVDGESARSVQVRVGSSTHQSGGTVISVKTVVNNPEYNSNTIDNDVGLLELSQPISLGTNAAVVPLVSENEEPQAGQPLLVSGWGTLTENGATPNQLQSVTVPIVDRKACDTAYVNYGGITASMICAAEDNGGKDSCQGDSGGPAVVNGKQAGVVSWGLGCARKGYPGVYSNVADSKVRSFIRRTTGV